ncbi:hypothetical protein [Negadavirga shengliensis]|uniref:hypothetical protein n=1 Tax=Negadavirga shengliensis TaxID=1389218 RepID=UPI00366E1BDF
MDYGLTDDPFSGFQRSLETFNAYKELKSRDEGLNIIFDHYSNLDFSQINQLKVSAEIGKFSPRISGLELMMTDFSLGRNLSMEESEQFLRVVSKKYDEKLVNEHELMGRGKLTTAFLAANIMNGQNSLKNKFQSEEELNRFLSNIRIISNDFIEEILNQLKTI